MTIDRSDNSQEYGTALIKSARCDTCVRTDSGTSNVTIGNDVVTRRCVLKSGTRPKGVEWPETGSFVVKSC